MGYPHQRYQRAPTGEFPADRQLLVSNRVAIKRAGRALFTSPSFLCRNMLRCTVVFCLLTVMSPHGIYCGDVNITDVAEQTENTLAKLVKMFSKPGAFKQIDTILGENTIEASYTSCPMGEEGLECRRAEARRSVDCPRGDCFCYDCAAAGPDLWASCCRESLRCCSHLAAACRTCDHPTLYPFCAKHFKKCLTQYNEKRQN